MEKTVTFYKLQNKEGLLNYSINVWFYENGKKIVVKLLMHCSSMLKKKGKSLLIFNTSRIVRLV